ncbi:molybdopterin-dependent oxidoreductase [Desulforhabdus sp. TSK]|uniref:molybdopterin-dependent oxidoreductase n=1 Tax=Desulforhabdus sp. TSK TaxID=2925014 RepID=UPI001FC88E44|nr:molybdopterin-dependent oxidoreductase [Desulforhabdus sp. TSK]GKT10848.1 formate dehydrogenase subunit alpha [Desulforhabdus sp. TSK]
MNSIKLWINDHEVEVEPGLTIMEAADATGIHIPRLCYHPSLKASGSCRLCAVEIDGYRGLPAACSTPVEEGMRVVTETPKVQDFRREMLRLILQDHPRECLGCPRNGTCELQQLVASVGIDFSYPPPTERRPPLKSGGAYFERDTSLCVRCGRCVRICHEVRGASTIVFREKAGRQEVGTPFDRSLEEAGCQFCGACVDVCPVGALRERNVTYQGEARQAMLQVCENLTGIVMSLYRKEMERNWKSSVCPLCGAGCRMHFELTETDHIVQVLPDSDGPGNLGQACVQGRFLLKDFLQKADRLKQPLVGENGGYAETDWNAVLDRMAGKLKGFGPGETAVVTDGRTTNEELYLLQKFAREVLKTDAVACLAPRGHTEAQEVLRKNFGTAAGTLSFTDLHHAGVVLTVGFNPAADQPIAGTQLRKAVMGGTKLVAATPCSTAAARYADIPLFYRPGTELTLVSGLMHLVLKENPDLPGLKQMKPADREALDQRLAAYAPETVSQITGVSPEQLLEAACLLAGRNPVSILYGAGLLESTDIPQTVQGLVTLAQVTGSLGKPGGGVAPAYGSGNLQGAWDMGMVSHLLPGQVERNGAPGLAAEDILQAAAGGKIKALYMALEAYDTQCLHFLRSLRGKVEFVVLQNVVLSPSLSESAPADVVLPMASVLEKGGSLTSGERRIQWADKVLDPPGEAKSVQWVVSELAQRMGASGFQYSDTEGVLDEIRRKVAAYAGMTPERKSVQWPCPRTDEPGSPLLLGDALPSVLSWEISIPAAPTEIQDKEYPFSVVARERLNAYFSGPLLAEESLSVCRSTGEIEMNPADAFTREFLPGDTVHVVTRHGEWEGKLAVNGLLPSKVVALPLSTLLKQGSDQNEGSIVFAARVEKR